MDGRRWVQVQVQPTTMGGGEKIGGTIPPHTYEGNKRRQFKKRRPEETVAIEAVVAAAAVVSAAALD